MRRSHVSEGVGRVLCRSHSYLIARLVALIAVPRGGVNGVKAHCVPPAPVYILCSLAAILAQDCHCDVFCFTWANRRN